MIDTTIDKGYTSAAVKGMLLISCLLLDWTYKSDKCV